MEDSTPSPIRLFPVAVGLIMGALLTFVSVNFVPGLYVGPSPSDAVASDGDELQTRNGLLVKELDTALAQIAQLQREAEQTRRQPLAVKSDPSAREVIATKPKRDAVALRLAIDTALGAGDGHGLLRLLDELAALGEVNHPAVAAQWARLLIMDAAALDRLGLSRIDLASAMARSDAIMEFALSESDLDPTLRQFAARTLEQASLATRRAILDELDFSTEKDKTVLFGLVRATDGLGDEKYVERFHHLVERTDLYNDSRSSIAFRIAAIGGDKARAAIDQLRQNSGGKGLFRRMLPVLESIYSPPATGLLVTNGMKPGDQRIGHNDLILEYAGQTIRTRTDLTRADAKTKPGQSVSVKILRDGVEHILLITVTDTAPGHLHFSSRPVKKR